MVMCHPVYVLLEYLPTISFTVPTAQSSADNAETVGLMAEWMAEKAWHFAQSAAPSATPPKGRRSYSTTAAQPTAGMYSNM